MCDCVFCKRGGLAITTVGPSLVEAPPQTIEEVVSSLVEVGAVGRLVMIILLNGEDVTGRQHEPYSLHDRLTVVASAY